MKLDHVEVIISSVKGDEDSHAHLIKGYIRLGRRRFGFNGVAFGRVGGFNASVNLTETAKRRLRQLGLNKSHLTELELRAQQMLVSGNFKLLRKGAAHEHAF
jgi:hypothetical protein